MRNVRNLLIAPALLILQACTALQPTNVVPGLAYYSGPEELGGRLVFLLRHDYTDFTNSASAASIFEFDLRTGGLRKVADCPAGNLVVSDQGDPLCVVYRPGDWSVSDDTNLFIYSESAGGADSLSLTSPPVFVCLNGTRLCLETELRGTQGVDRVYDIGQRRWVTPLASDVEVANEKGGFEGFKVPGGRWIFFEGREGPITGSRLVSAPWDCLEAEFHKGEESRVKRIAQFRAGVLCQASPDGRYALVSLPWPATRKAGLLPGYTNTYYIVDLQTGAKRVLLEDRVEHLTTACISVIHWVGSSSEQRTRSSRRGS